MQIWVNADDYGWDKSCTKAILGAFEKGYVTTTTACANGEAFSEAAELILDTPYKSSVGIHINLTEGIPLTDGIRKNQLFCKEGIYDYFPHRYTYLSVADKKDVYNEMIAQIATYLKTGLSIHHADSHHHVHNAPSIFPIYLTVMKEQGIRGVRLFRNYGNIPAIRKLGKAYFNCILRSRHLSYTDLFGYAMDYYQLGSMPGRKLLEIMVHPDYDGDGTLIDRSPDAMYDNPFGEELGKLRCAINANADILQTE